jgi:formylglycine-generating enzyme required for sulfatase activity
MVWVPAGRYRRGASDGDRQASPHEFPVRVFEVGGFWMDRSEVTNADYRRCVEDGGCTPPTGRAAYDVPGKANHPVLWVSWLQAWRYAQWAGKRLPSEVEWEWAARGGAATRYPWGEEWDSSRANGLGIEGRDRFTDDAPVGSFPANQWGLVDLIGNAAEYVHDVYHASYDRAPPDGRPWQQETGPIGERLRVIRGGSFLDLPVRLRVSHRDARPSESASRAIGFRCVAD